MDGDWIESPYITDDGIRLVQTGNIGIGEFVEKPDSQKYITAKSFKELGCKWVYPGDILISRLADPIGRACRIPRRIDSCVTAVDCTIYRPDPEVMDSAFALHFLNWRQHLSCLEALSGGSTRRRISRSNLGDVSFILPPLSEQRRIAEILDAADEAIQQSERVIAKLREVKKGLLHDLLTRGLDGEGNLRDPEAHPEQFKDSPLGRIPREWEITDLGSLGTWRGGSTPSKSEPANWNEGTVIWLSPKDMKNSQLSTSEDKITGSALSSSGLTLFDPGDVVVVFRSGILRHSFPVAVTDVPFTVNQDLKVLIPGPLVDREFAFWLLEGMGSLILNKAVKAGTTVESIDPYAFYHLPVALPSLGEQRRITPILNAEDVRIQAEKAALNKLRQVKRGLMDDLLTGRVRV